MKPAPWFVDTLMPSAWRSVRQFAWLLIWPAGMGYEQYLAEISLVY